MRIGDWAQSLIPKIIKFIINFFQTIFLIILIYLIYNILNNKMNETPISEKEINSYSKDFNIKSNKENEFIIKISLNYNCIDLNGKYKDNKLIWHNFSLKQTMKEIQRNNKYFIKFDNLHEIYEELCSLLDNSKIFEETNKILLHIPLKEINLELKENEKNEKEKIEELFSIISNYNKEIEELKKNINIINENKNKEIEELKKNINEINENKK